MRSGRRDHDELEQRMHFLEVGAQLVGDVAVHGLERAGAVLHCWEESAKLDEKDMEREIGE